MAAATSRLPWLVGIHYRLRTVSFAMVFVAAGLQIFGKDYGLPVWLSLGLGLLVYPHLQYWRAARAVDPVAVEMNNLVADSVLLGAIVAALGFSSWIGFSAAIGTLSNNAANKGWRGVPITIAALAAGSLAWIAAAGFRFAPQTDWPATLFCMFGLGGYLLAMGHLGYTRNLQLRQVRERLQQREAELLTANESLRSNLDEIDELHHQLREQADRDPLTGLHNRRYLDKTLERELERCKRDGHPLSLLVVDIDRFKQVNDTYGHQAGDEMLVGVGALLGGTVRAGDISCRYGGEEFLIAMPNMPLERAAERAEHLRCAFAASVVEFGDFRLQTTLSIGISVYPGNGTAVDELIRAADRALYRAKHGGRNRVEFEALAGAESAPKR